MMTISQLHVPTFKHTRHELTEILLKVALNTINQTNQTHHLSCLCALWVISLGRKCNNSLYIISGKNARSQ